MQRWEEGEQSGAGTALDSDIGEPTQCREGAAYQRRRVEWITPDEPLRILPASFRSR
jgi:hypothetical protein